MEENKTKKIPRCIFFGWPTRTLAVVGYMIALIVVIPCTLIGIIRFLVVKERNDIRQTAGTVTLKDIIKKLNEILVGYYHYYEITDNIQSLSNFRYRMMKSLFKWLNRRSQKKSYNWEGFNDMLKVYPLAMPKIYVNVYAR